MRQASLVGFDTIIASGIDENLDSQLLHAQKNIYTLAQVCQRLSSGKSITAADIQDSGEYPVYGANGVRGYASVSNFKGECAIIGRQGAYCGNVHYFSGEAYMSEHAVVAHPNELADARYLAYLLSLMDLSRLQGQSAQPGLSVQTLAKQNIQLPDIATQQRIGNLLGVLDKKIELNRQLNDNLEAMAQALYDYWFVQFDFPDENGKPYKTSGGKMVWNDRLKREIPEGWSAQPLFDVASVLYGYPFKTELFTENEKDLPVIRIRDILDNTFSAYSSEPIHGKYLTQKGDLLIGMDGNFHLNYWHRDGDGVNQRVVRIRSCTSTLSNIQLKLELAPYIKMREMSVTRSTVGHLGDKDFKERYIVVAPETSTFNPAKALNALLERMTSLVAETQKLTKQRDFLLPLLMNGQVQVKPLNYRLSDD